MKKPLFALCLAFCMVTFAKAQFCSTDTRFTNAPYFTDAQLSEQLNVIFANATDYTGSNQNLKLDVYYPNPAIDAMPLRPFILLIHGGSFVSGTKAKLTQECIEFAKRGFVAATINYRIGVDCNTDNISLEKAEYRAQQDAHAALRYIVQNAASFGIDTSWIFAGGESAGAVTALGLVYNSQSEWNSFTPGIQTALGNLNTSGNTLTNVFSLKGIFNNWGGMAKDVIQTNEMLPMVSFHGDADNTVPIDSANAGGCINNINTYGSRPLHNLLISNAVCSELTVKPAGGHGVYKDSLGTIFRVGRACCFFKSLFCNNCVSFFQTDSVPANCSLTTGTDEPSNENISRVFPNPFTGFIQITNLQATETCLLFNQLGQTIYCGKSISTNNFSSLFPGIYYLKTETKTYKVIKE
jgi:hypothetical protein